MWIDWHLMYILIQLTLHFVCSVIRDIQLYLTDIVSLNYLQYRVDKRLGEKCFITRRSQSRTFNMYFLPHLNSAQNGSTYTLAVRIVHFDDFLFSSVSIDQIYESTQVIFQNKWSHVAGVRWKTFISIYPVKIDVKIILPSKFMDEKEYFMEIVMFSNPIKETFQPMQDSISFKRTR